MSTQTTLNIEIISDTLCPWCFVGKRRLEQAMKRAPQLTFNVRWKPYYLNPNTPPEGYDLKSYLEAKYGQSFDLTNPNFPLNVAGREVGINFNPSRRVVNSRDSHRLIEFAFEEGGQAAQDRMVEALFRAYFEGAKDISHRDVLTKVASEAGFDAAKVREFLESGRLATEVDQGDFAAKARRINGVPHFTISRPDSKRRVQFSGAQDPETFISAFQHVLEN